MELTKDEAHTVREWFDAVQDMNAGYLYHDDYALARKLYEHLEMRVPSSIKKKTPEVG